MKLGSSTWLGLRYLVRVWSSRHIWMRYHSGPLSIPSLPPFIQFRPHGHPSYLKEPLPPLQLHWPARGAALAQAASKLGCGLPPLLFSVCALLLSQPESVSVELQAAHRRLIFACPRTDGIAPLKSNCWRSFRRLSSCFWRALRLKRWSLSGYRRQSCESAPGHLLDLWGCANSYHPISCARCHRS